jgi:hypothetical protein
MGSGLADEIAIPWLMEHFDLPDNFALDARPSRTPTTQEERP